MTLNKATHYLFLTMLFSPLISILTRQYLGLYSSTYYFQFLICILGVFTILVKNASIKLNLIHVTILCYLVYIIAWSFFNGYFEEKGLFNVSNINIISLFFVFIIINSTNFSREFIEKSVLIIKITVIVATIASIIQVFNLSFLDATSVWAKDSSGGSVFQDMYKFRRNSIFGFIDPNEVGLSFVPLLSVLIGYLIYNNKKQIALYIVLGGLICILTNTRYILIGFFIVLMQFLLAYKINLSVIIKYAFYLMITLTSLYFILFYLGYDINDWFENRVFEEGSLKETTRYSAVTNFLRFFPDKPFLGIGVHMTREIQIASNESGSSQIHVGYLAHLVSYGIVGSLLLFGFWFLIAKKLYDNAKRTRYYGSFFAFLMFLWANATMPKYSMIYYGLIFAFIFDKIFCDYTRLLNKNENNRMKLQNVVVSSENDNFKINENNQISK